MQQHDPAGDLEWSEGEGHWQLSQTRVAFFRLNLNLEDMMEISWPGERIVIRFIDLVDKGFSGLLTPYQIRRTGKATAETIACERKLLADVNQEITAKARQQFEALEDHSEPVLMIGSGGVGEGKPDPSPAADGSTPEDAFSAFVKGIDTEARIVEETDRVQRLLRGKRAVLHAIEHLRDKDIEPTKDAPELDQDWLNRWRQFAEATSDDEMLNVWGRILAGEFEKPGSIGFRAMSIMSSMSRSEARTIEKVAQIRLRDLIPDDDDLFSGFEITHAELIELEGMGLLSGESTSAGIRRNWVIDQQSNHELTLVLDDDTALLIKSDQDITLELVALPLTIPGLQIMKLVHPQCQQGVIDYFVMSQKDRPIGVAQYKGKLRDDGSFEVKSRKILKELPNPS